MNPLDNYNLLESEIDRIVSCSYPSQLKTLHDVLITSNDTDILSWALQQPRQISLLAQCVIYALGARSYAWDVLVRLSTSKHIRDAFLDCDPGLLHQTLSSALETSQADAVKIHRAVALLKHALPDTITLPDHAQTFLLNVFEQATNDPGKATLQPLHALVTGACQPLLHTLPTEYLQTFQRHVFAILGQTSDMDDPIPSLYCLSIMKSLCCNTLPQIHDSTHAVAPDLSHMTAFFSGPKAYKTLHLLALRLIWACRTDRSSTAAQASLCADLACRIVAGVEESARYSWSSRNRPIVAKLAERASKTEVDSVLRLQVVTFLGAVCHSRDLPSIAITTCLELLLEPSQVCVAESTFVQFLSLSFLPIAERFAQEHWKVLLDRILEVTTSQTSTGYLPLAAFISRILEYTALHLTTLTYLQSVVERLIREASLLARLNLSVAPLTAEDSTVSAARLGLIRAICTLLLIRTTMSPVANSPDMSVHAILALLVRCSSTPEVAAIVPCALTVRPESNPAPHVSHASDSGQNWRSTIAGLVQQQAEDQKRSMYDAFSQMCEALETRCANVEAPLVAARQRAQLLEEHIEQLRATCAQHEMRDTEHSLTLSAMRNQHGQLSIELQHLRDDKHGLQVQLQQSNTSLKATSHSKDHELAQMQLRLEQADMAAATAAARTEDLLENMREEQKSWQQKLHDTSVRLSTEQGLTASKHDEIAQWENQCKGIAAHLEHAQEQNEQMKLSIQALDVRDKASTAECERLRNQLITIKQDLQEVLATHGQEMTGLQTRHEEQIAVKQSQWQEKAADQEHRIDKLDRDLIDAVAAHDASVAEMQAEIQVARKKTEKIDRECHRKDAQIQEAQAMRDRLMSAMGLARAAASATPKQSTLAIRSASSGVSAVSQSPTTPSHYGTEVPWTAEMVPETARSLKAAQRGSTPRRSRTRRAFKVPRLQHTRSSAMAASSLRHQRSPQREPLEELDVNRSPSRPTRSVGKVAFNMGGTATDVVSTAGRNALAEWSFTTDVITSTPGIGNEGGMKHVQVHGMEHLDEHELSTADA